MAASNPVSVANTAFSMALYKKMVQEKPQGNVFYSPLSISSALAMVLMGAGGNTASQMAEALHHGRSPDINASFCKLLAELNKPGAAYSLSLANRLYGEQTYQFVQDFLAETKKFYDAELQTMDFQTKHEEARVTINSQVEQQTQGKIQNLLAPGIVDNMTRLVLVNAIYFKGNWDQQFDKKLTRDAPFKVSQNETKTVKMMHRNDKYPLTFIGDANCRVLEMPYQSKELSMLIFLPVDSNGTASLHKLEEQLTPENFAEWTRPDMMDVEKVQVGLPRFKMTETYDMKGLLQNLGMVDAFDQARCDFSGMSPRNDLALSEVVHKAFVEVNEEGTEAAAATAAVMMMRCAVRGPPPFICDHPFLFFIRHNPTNTVLFSGRYVSPE